MGRMKDVYMQVVQANDGIPEGMTIADIAQMQEWNIYQWQEYEREAEKRRLQHSQSEDPREIAKTEQAIKKFSKTYGQAKEKRDEQ